MSAATLRQQSYGRKRAGQRSPKRTRGFVVGRTADIAADEASSDAIWWSNGVHCLSQQNPDGRKDSRTHACALAKPQSDRSGRNIYGLYDFGFVGSQAFCAQQLAARRPCIARAVAAESIQPEAHFILPGWLRSGNCGSSRASVGRNLIHVPGYTFRIFATNRDDAPELVWRDYNRRADMENRIAELKHDLGIDHFCLKQFHATETAFRTILRLLNLLAEFQRTAGLPSYSEPATIRTQILTCGAILGRSARRIVVHPGESWGGLKTRNPSLTSILERQIPTSPKFSPLLRC